jgi:hypothetical protein
MKLNARALGFTSGAIWGLTVLIITLVSVASARSYGRYFLYCLASVYPGYSITNGGALLGLCYGFADGFACGWLVAKLYNYFAKE